MMQVPGPSGADDTAALQALVNANPHTTIYLLKDVDYRLDGTLLITNSARLIGNGTRLVAHGQGTRNRSQVRIVGGTSVLEGIGIKGANPDGGLADDARGPLAPNGAPLLEGQHCLEVAGVQSFTLESCPLSDPYGDLIYLSSAPGVNQCVRILNSPGTRTGRNGWTINGVRGLLVDNCPSSEVRVASIDIEPTSDTTEVGGVTIRNTTFGSHRGLFLAAENGLHPPVHDFTLEDCSSPFPFNMIFAGTPTVRRRNLKLLRLVSTAKYSTPSGAEIDVRYVDGVTSGELHLPLVVPHSPPMRAISYTNCSNITEGATA